MFERRARVFERSERDLFERLGAGKLEEKAAGTIAGRADSRAVEPTDLR
jgi:hypothetical protein